MALERAVSKLGLASRTQARALVAEGRIRVNGVRVTTSGVPRVYLVTVAGRVEPDAISLLLRGVRVDGESLTAAAAEIRKASTRESHLVLTLTEGKNREVRRLLTAVGHPVTRLRRVAFGALALGTLAPGAWHELAAGELSRAFPDRPQPRKRAPISPRRRNPASIPHR